MEGLHTGQTSSLNRLLIEFFKSGKEPSTTTISIIGNIRGGLLLCRSMETFVTEIGGRTRSRHEMRRQWRHNRGRFIRWIIEPVAYKQKDTTWVALYIKSDHLPCFDLRAFFSWSCTFFFLPLKGFLRWAMVRKRRRMAFCFELVGLLRKKKSCRTFNTVFSLAWTAPCRGETHTQVGKELNTNFTFHNVRSLHCKEIVWFYDVKVVKQGRGAVHFDQRFCFPLLGPPTLRNRTVQCIKTSPIL